MIIEKYKDYILTKNEDCWGGESYFIRHCVNKYYTSEALDFCDDISAIIIFKEAVDNDRVDEVNSDYL